MADTNEIIGILDDTSDMTGTLDGDLIRGYSAYEIYLENGGTLSEEEWLGSLHGANGHTPEITSEKVGTREHKLYSDGVEFASVFDGFDGTDGHTPEITASKTGNTTTISVDGTDVAEIVDGEKGDPGDPGDDGFSPTASVSKSGNTATITITDKNGTTTAQVSDGAKGDPGDTPEITAERSGTDTTIYADGTSIAVIHDGQDGDPGQDGVSPSARVAQTSTGATITITDKDGTTTANISNGQPGSPGEPGEDGHTPEKGVDYWTASDKASIVSDVLNSQEISQINQDISNLSGTVSGKYTKPSGGIPASDLASGVIPNVPVTDVQVNGTSILNQGVAEIPVAVSEGGYGVVKLRQANGIYVASDGSLVFVRPSNSSYKSGANNYQAITPYGQHMSVFYGLAKAAGDATQSSSSNAVGVYTETAQSKIHEMLDAPVIVSGTTPTITGKTGIRYICGEVSTLSITAPESGCIDVVFTSGSTPTVLTVTSAKTGVTAIKWMNGFDPTSLDANTTYEINILDGELGVSGSWT